MATSEAKSELLASETFEKDGGERSSSKQVMVSDAASIEEASPDPDSLKNTPSNIAKLEDVIEQCKAREKYLAHTKSPSDGEDVRWYFCKVPLAENELAASVPRKEIVGKNEYFRFSRRDSLALEASFLCKEEELLSNWWKEYADCSEGPSEPPRISNVSEDNQPKLSSPEVSQPSEHHAIEEERVGVPVKGGLYEVDLAKRHCFPVYWSGENRRVLRGHWFARNNGLDWLPLREDIAEQLEFAYRCQIWHRRTFQPSGLFAARIDLQGSTQGLHALFTGEDDTWEAWLGNNDSGFSQAIGFRGNGVKLRRGFSTSGSAKPTQDELRQQKEEEMDDYCSQVPVRHLVFMVHGIGQRLEKANLVDDVGDFRHLTSSLAEQHLTSYQRNMQRVLFIPCQWRRGLKLGGESAVEKITLDGVRGLRVMLSATVHDVLYYMSPIYCQDIINSVSNQLNKLYLKFIKRNPGYDGKVSIYAHSLGSVLSYDILCHQLSLSSPLPMESIYRKLHTYLEPQIHAANRSSESGTSVDVDNKNAQCSDEATVEQELPSTSQPSAAVHEEENTRNLHPIVTSDKEQVSSRTSGPPSPVEEKHTFSEKAPVINHAIDFSLSKEDGRVLVENFSPLIYQSTQDLDLNTNLERQASGGDKDGEAGDLSESVKDKDELISTLMEKVNLLKAKIAKLESMGNCSVVRKVGDRTVQETNKGSAKQFFSQLLPPDQDDSRKSYTPYIKYTKLEFKVDTFFAVGSPLGVFLALRNVRIGIGKGKEYWEDDKISEEMPACRQMFNIFHPFDPVAYRVEPLVCKEFIGKRPVRIRYHKGGKRLHIGFQDFTEDLVVRSEAVVSQLNAVREPHMEVISPGSKGLQTYIANRLLVFLYRQFRANEKPSFLLWVQADELSAQFPNLQEPVLRKRVEHCADLQRGANGQLFWVMRRNFRISSEEELRRLVTPENDRENFERLEITGVGDPSGRGLGFSYVRVAPKAPIASAAIKKKVAGPRGGSTVTGTDADLRRLSMDAAREQSRSVQRSRNGKDAHIQYMD